LLKGLEPGAKAFRIELTDRKRSNAALRASRMAHQPWTAASGCIRERCIYDLYEPLITLRKHTFKHSENRRGRVHSFDFSMAAIGNKFEAIGGILSSMANRRIVCHGKLPR
jgi:hypothetical protein